MGIGIVAAATLNASLVIAAELPSSDVVVSVFVTLTNRCVAPKVNGTDSWVSIPLKIQPECQVPWIVAG